MNGVEWYETEGRRMEAEIEKLKEDRRYLIALVFGILATFIEIKHSDYFSSIQSAEMIKFWKMCAANRAEPETKEEAAVVGG